MLKVFGFLAIFVPFASSTASAQEFKSIEFPGAVTTILSGGPNLEGTSVGDYTDASGFTHGFSLTAGGKLRRSTRQVLDLRLRILSIWRGRSGGFLDPGGVSRGFVLKDGQFTTLDFPGAAGTILTGISSLGEISGESCDAPLCNTTTHSFVRSVRGVFTSFDPPGAAQQRCQHC